MVFGSNWTPSLWNKNPPQTFWKACKECWKGGRPKSTSRRIPRRQEKAPKELEKCAHHNPRNGRNAGVARRQLSCLAKKSYQGIDLMLLYLLPLDEQNEPKTDCCVPDWGHFLQQEVDQNNIKDVQRPLFYRLGKETTIPAKGKERILQLYPFSHSRASLESLRVLPFLCPVGRKAVPGCL